MPFDIGGALGGIGSFLGNQISSAVNSHRAWKYAKKSMKLQDKYNRNMIRDYYGLNRESLESAGYNPLLAVPGSTAQGANYGSSMSIADSDAGDQAISSAINAQTAKANIKTAKTQSELNEANSSLAKQQAETEKSKRISMEFDNAMKDVQTQLSRKDLDWYDRKANMTLYNMFEQAKNYRASSAIGAMNADTARQSMINSYDLGKNTKTVKAGPVSYSGYVPDYKPNYTYSHTSDGGHRYSTGYGLEGSNTPLARKIKNSKYYKGRK